MISPLFKETMPVFEYNGVKVEFPFEPYAIQQEYMRMVIDAIQTHSNAMLESPTGTGKVQMNEWSNW